MLVQSPETTEDSFRGFSKAERTNRTNDKMEQQQQHLQHIKRLLSTAATATGIVGDVDAPTSMPRKGERNLWRMEEIKEMLTIMQETNALDLLNDKMVKSEKVFYDIEKMMFRRGYRKKSHNQIWTKWKFLKSTYMTSRRNGIIPKMIPKEIYLILHKMLGNGSELDLSLEDSSNGASMEDEHSIDEESNNPMTKLNGDVDESSNSLNISREEKTDLGMAHPIFGFRLGLVKSEPVDTGYETTANNSVISENDSLDNSVAYPVGLSPQHSQHNLTEHSNSMYEIKMEPDERVTDSPTTVQRMERTPSPLTDNSLLVPRETASMSIRPLPIQQKITPTKKIPMPPLRIAPFARETNIALKRSDCPPPLRTINSTRLPAAQLHSINGNNRLNSHTITNTTSSSSATTTTNSAIRPSLVRLPRDVTLQLRTDLTNTAIPPHQSIKPFPIQQASGYVLRPEERINNRTAMNIQSHHNYQQQQEQPMTSQMAKLKSVIMNNKKRRLEIPNWNNTDMQTPNKVPRFLSPNVHNNSNSRNNSYATNNSKHITAEDNEVGVDYDEDNDNDNIDYDYSVRPQYIPTTTHKSKPSQPASTSTPNDSSKIRSPMEEVLKDMAMSLRQSQLQMVNEFFDQQMELARKEHEFQMEQDRLLLSAFKKQTQQLMKVAKELFGGTDICEKTDAANETNTSNVKTFIKNASKITASQDEVDFHDHDSSQHTELSSNVENELLENTDSDPLLATFDPTQFVSSELVEINDEDDEGESLV